MSTSTSTSTSTSPTGGIEQEQYQVRFDSGVEGSAAIGVNAAVLVLVDVLGEATTTAESIDSPGAVVVAGSLRNCAAVANWVLGRQATKGDRFTIAIVAAGERRQGGSTRFAVEDFLGAGAIIDALAAVGIDYCSPEAAAASAAYTGLRNATRHLVGASTSGRALTANGDRAALDAAIALNSSEDVPILRELQSGL